MRLRLRLNVALAIAFVPAVLFAQAEVRPARELTAFRGTWKIDESLGRGHIGGLPVARTLVIATSPEELRLTKDGAALKLQDGQVTDQSGAGHLAELEDPSSNRQTIVYRRGR